MRPIFRNYQADVRTQPVKAIVLFILMFVSVALSVLLFVATIDFLISVHG